MALLAANLTLLALVGTLQAAPHPGEPAIPPEVTARIEAALEARDRSTPPRTRHLTPLGEPRFANRLILEKSPYLQQHAFNPVNWYPWGEEAFARAEKLERLVFLSIGYSTCHWCHVMEEESFEDLEVAEVLNRHFITIKVDREERPDIDGIYMEAVRTLTKRGGWPLTVLLTPDGYPIYGGTYFPPRDGARGRRPGLLSILKQVRLNYEENPARARASALSLVARVQANLDPPPAVGIPGPSEIRKALSNYKRRFDNTNGGVQSRTKFPSSLPIPFLLRAHRRSGDPRALEMARVTLDAMRTGGIYDHIGGGFHRYTVEPTWTVPHFEKMLYDNALLTLAYTEAYQVTGDEAYANVVRDVLEYLAREMTSQSGTFYSATDADSEGEEGRYFVWTPGEVRAATGPDLAPLALAAYGVTARGNFEGRRTVLRRKVPVSELASQFKLEEREIEGRLETIRLRLREVRSKRIPPLTDHKQIVAWNGLAISAFARAGLTLREPVLIERAARAAGTILKRGRPRGRLARYLLEGEPHRTGLLDDHAFLIAGLLDLFEATGDPRWLEEGVALQRDLDRYFFDDSGGAYYLTPSDGEKLLVREKPVGDGAVPSGNSVEAMNLLRLYLLTTDEDHRMRAEMTVRAFSEYLARGPTGLGRMLEAVDFMTDRPKEILIVTPHSHEEAEPFLLELSRVFLPNRVLVVARASDLETLAVGIPLLKHKRAMGGKTTAYVCEDRVCDLPARDVKTFARQIRADPAPYVRGR